MITESKVIELFCMADDFCKFFDSMMAKYTLGRVNQQVQHYEKALKKTLCWSEEIEFFPLV